MSTDALAARIPRRRPTRSGRGVDDALAVTWRNLVVLGRTPQLLVFATTFTGAGLRVGVGRT